MFYALNRKLLAADGGKRSNSKAAQDLICYNLRAAAPKTGYPTIAPMDTIPKNTIPKDTIPKDTIPKDTILNGHNPK